MDELWGRERHSAIISILQRETKAQRGSELLGLLQSWTESQCVSLLKGPSLKKITGWPA